MRDPKGTYNKIDRAGVQKAMPHFGWDGLLEAHNLGSLVDITVSAPGFLTGVDKLLTTVPPATWRNFVLLSVMGSSSSLLTKKLEDISFKLRQKIEGAAEQKVRWKRCVAQTDHALGESLGQVFVRDRFPGASKDKIEEEVRAIVTAMRNNLESLVWMDPATRVKAQEKLAAMAYHLGYPAKWKTYAFKIDVKTFAANVLAARKEARARDLAKIGKPVDRTEWGMTTPTVNAYYDPSQNKMVFPAGILQTPFYQVDHGAAVNLGGIGVVIGHELTHGFDDQGAQFDAVGNLKNWWQPETEQRFKDRTRCVIDQYSKYPAGGRTVNGALTAGENIADIGGVKLALAAYRGLRATAPDTLVADGFTEDQQFFLGFAQTWCDKMRPEYEASLVLTDPHSPSQWRVNGSLAATPEFSKAFGCKVGAKLRPQNACTVW
jgi:putative endopeptidase